MYKIEKQVTKGTGVQGFIKRLFFIDIFKGMKLTFVYFIKNLFSRTISLRYPDDEKWIPYRRFRGALTLNRDVEGRELCVGCELCAKICPTNCLTVVPTEDFNGKGISDRIAAVYDWDSARCLFCGYCEEACPTTAVRMGRDFELATFKRADAVKNKEYLLEPQTIPESMEGGYVVKARFEKSKDGMIKVIPLLDSAKKVRKL